MTLFQIMMLALIAFQVNASEANQVKAIFEDYLSRDISLSDTFIAEGDFSPASIRDNFLHHEYEMEDLVWYLQPHRRPISFVHRISTSNEVSLYYQDLIDCGRILANMEDPTYDDILQFFTDAYSHLVMLRDETKFTPITSVPNLLLRPWVAIENREFLHAFEEYLAAYRRLFREANSKGADVAISEFMGELKDVQVELRAGLRNFLEVIPEIFQDTKYLY